MPQVSHLLLSFIIDTKGASVLSTSVQSGQWLSSFSIIKCIVVITLLQWYLLLYRHQLTTYPYTSINKSSSKILTSLESNSKELIIHRLINPNKYDQVLKLPIVLDPILSLPTTSLSGQATLMSAYSQLIEYFLWQKIKQKETEQIETLLFILAL